MTSHLGRGVVGAAAAGLEEVAVAHDVGQPKVGDLDVHLGVKQQVLWFQVAVHHLRAAVAAAGLGQGQDKGKDKGLG